MSVQCVLVEYEDKEAGKVYANSGCLVLNKYVIVTSNVLITLLAKHKNVETKLKSLTPGISAPEALLEEVPEVNVVINNGNSYLYKREIDVTDQVNAKNNLICCIEEICSVSQHNDIEIGDKIIIEGAPFANRNFLKTHSRGIISNIFGAKKSFILTDTPTAPGCEGSPIYLKSKTKGTIPIGIVLAALTWWKGEWVGLTLGASFTGVFSTIIHSLPTTISTTQDHNLSSIRNVMNKSLVQVISGVTWGTGILLDKEKGIFLTNSHVVENTRPVLYWNDVKVKARVVYKTPENEAYDIAILHGDLNSLRETDMQPITIFPEETFLGETVYAVGFPLFPKALKLRPTLTKGNISQITPNMIKTSCSVLPGASGGGILRKNGQLLGLIVSNAKMGDDSSVPRINMAIPLINISNILRNYIKTLDVSVLEDLKKETISIKKEWNFLRSSL